MTKKILIIDDDIKLVELLSEYLGGHQFEISYILDGLNALNEIKHRTPDFIILDYMMPGKDGLEVLREIRAHYNLPIIMLTARGDETDRIVGLELGADDYLPKPFNPRELLARIKAILRRGAAQLASNNNQKNDLVIQTGDLILNRAAHTIEVNGIIVDLSTTEFKILEVLMKNPNRVLSRDQIMTMAQVEKVQQLNQSALEFADGNLSCRTDIKGCDEIAKLGNSFNFMADKLEKLIQGNKELTANISHELRGPLTRIRVSKELIQDRIDQDRIDQDRIEQGRLDPTHDKDIKRYVQNIDQDIDILDDLIDKILKLSKMDVQESLLSVEQIDIKMLMIDLEKKYKPSLKQKNLALKTNYNSPIILNADKNIITSILSNIFDNAVKYAKKKGSIHITAFKSEDDILTFSITNTYRKLDPLELEKLFEPFYRIKNNKNPGSGLGLCIVKKQLKLCNGNIIAKNSQTGLTFEVQFSNQKIPY